MQPASRSVAAASIRALACGLIALATLLGVSDASAQIDEPPARTLTGVLKRIKASGVVRIGYRAQAIPFSYEGRAGQPWGYSIDLCEAIVEDIAREIGVASLRTEFRRVTPSDRIDQVVDGRIDLECGSSTNTAERRDACRLFAADLCLGHAAAGPARGTGAFAARS